MVKAAIGAVREFGERTVRVKWVIPAYVLIGLTAFGVGYAVLEDSRQKREEAERLTAEAQYAAEVASFENARDELLRCEQRVDGRLQLRSVFLSIFELIDDRAAEGSTFVDDAIDLLNEDYPELAAADCPATPTPPTPPPSLTADRGDG